MKSKSWPQLSKLNQRLFDQLNIALNDDEKLIVFDSPLVKQRRIKKISNWNLFQFIYFNLASDFLEFFFVLLSVILFLSRLWKNSFKAIRILRYISRLLIVSVLFPYLMLCVPSNYVNQWVGKVMVKKNVPLMLDESWSTSRMKNLAATTADRGNFLYRNFRKL